MNNLLPFGSFCYKYAYNILANRQFMTASQFSKISYKNKHFILQGLGVGPRSATERRKIA